MARALLDYALMTDLYQLTMAQGYWRVGKLDEEACFVMYFRENPFKGGYAVACGMDQLAEMVETYGFDDEDLAYLEGLDSPLGGRLFDPEFLAYLHDMEFTCDIEAVHEGTVVFPNEPLVRVVGPILQCQLIETPLLNAVNFETLIATKAARVVAAAGSPVAEFGLRRAQGPGGLWASRAAVVGGCANTSNVLAGKLYDIPVSGTHSHSWVMSFESELEAFRAYAREFPGNCVLLIDTYDIRQGLENAITVGLEMKERGERLLGVRIDSGDLAWQAKFCRERLDEAGLEQTGIVLSNDLDEYTVKSIRDQGSRVSSWGIGTKLATAFDQPTLGGVYKLSAVKHPGSGVWENREKVTASVTKLTFPGVLDIRRYFQPDGHLAGDMVFDVNGSINEQERIIDPFDDLRQKTLSGLGYEMLLHPLARAGKVVLEPEFRSAKAAAERTKAGIAQLHESQKRILNPHPYPVGLEANLARERRALAQRFGDVRS